MEIWPHTFFSEVEEVEWKPIEDESALTKASDLVSAQYSWLHLHSIKNGYACFEALSSKPCPICEGLHEKNQQYGFLCKDGRFILKCHHQKQYKPDHTGILFGEESKVSFSTSKKTVTQVSSAVSPDLRDYPEFQKKILERILKTPADSPHGYFLNIKAHFPLKTYDYLRTYLLP